MVIQLWSLVGMVRVAGLAQEWRGSGMGVAKQWRNSGMGVVWGHALKMYAYVEYNIK